MERDGGSNAQVTVGELKNALARDLRNNIFDQVQNILESADEITNSNTRLSVQAACLDLVSALEDVIADYQLNR